jgi:hypothetical protein
VVARLLPCAVSARLEYLPEAGEGESKYL